MRDAALSTASSLEQELDKSGAMLSAKLDAEVLRGQTAEKEAALKAKGLEEGLEEATKVRCRSHLERFFKHAMHPSHRELAPPG